MSIRDLERLRDDNLVGMMRALRHSQTGAGDVITRHEATLPAPALTLPAPPPAELPITVQRQIPPSLPD